MENAKSIIAQKDTITKDVKNLLSNVDSVKKNLPATKDAAYICWLKLPTMIKAVNAYQDKLPVTIIKKHALALERASESLAPEKVKAKADSITDLIGMNQQEFTSALLLFEELEQLIRKGDTAYSEAESMLEAQTVGQRRYKELIEKAEDGVKTALVKIKDSDVAGTTRSKAKVASSKLAEAKMQASGAKVDWATIMILLLAIIDDAKNAYRQAQADIDDAEDERRRKKREKEEEERATQRRNSYTPSSSFSNYRSSGGSSGFDSYGGFSGGGTGGGGAGGTW